MDSRDGFERLFRGDTAVRTSAGASLSKTVIFRRRDFTVFPFIGFQTRCQRICKVDASRDFRASQDGHSEIGTSSRTEEIAPKQLVIRDNPVVRNSPFADTGSLLEADIRE
jgi:hypothetical protein